jgi:hypothetical protein
VASNSAESAALRRGRAFTPRRFVAGFRRAAVFRFRSAMTCPLLGCPTGDCLWGMFWLRGGCSDVPLSAAFCLPEKGSPLEMRVISHLRSDS